ncbi:MAG TPA: RagB/SusD family nutrient uptake outer membrane protein, partial [Chryseosolibacter sp.]
ADLLLMAAECEVEVGSLTTATNYVNMVRTRAANSADFVKNATTNLPEATYVITNYPVFADKATATAAIRHERLIELAMEGHRFYDLVRWGIADPVLDAKIARESAKRTHLAGASFDAPADLYLPIPESVISQSKGNLTQN